jgi:hypothetical protein
MYLADELYRALWTRKFDGEDFSYIKAIALVRLSPLFHFPSPIHMHILLHPYSGTPHLLR